MRTRTLVILCILFVAVVVSLFLLDVQKDWILYIEYILGISLVVYVDWSIHTKRDSKKPFTT